MDSVQKESKSCCAKCHVPITEAEAIWAEESDCGHKIHFYCFVQWIDVIHRERPKLKALSCCECHKVTQIPTIYSINILSKWVHNVEIAGLSITMMLGAALGLMAYTKAKRFILFEKFCEHLASQVGPAVIWFPCMFASAAALGCLKLQPYLQDWIEEGVIAIYNPIYKTHFTLNDISQFHAIFKGDEIQFARSIYRLLCDKMALPIDTEFLRLGEDDEALKLEEEFEKQKESIAYLAGQFADSHCLSHVNRTRYTPNQLDEELSSFLLETFKTSQVVISNRQVAIGIAVARVLEECKRKVEKSSMNLLNKQKWSSIISDLQQQRLLTNSSVMSEAQEKITDDKFSNIQLVQLLFDREIFYQVRDIIFPLDKQTFQGKTFQNLPF